MRPDGGISEAYVLFLPFIGDFLTPLLALFGELDFELLFLGVVDLFGVVLAAFPILPFSINK